MFLVHGVGENIVYLEDTARVFIGTSRQMILTLLSIV